MPMARRRFLPFLAFGAILVATSCNITETYPLGKLSARVVDANGVGIQGVFLDLYKLEVEGPLLWRASVTGSDGVGEFGARDGGVIEGDYFIRVKFNSQHELAPGESNDRPVTVMEGDEIVVTFVAQRIAIGV